MHFAASNSWQLVPQFRLRMACNNSIKGRQRETATGLGVNEATGFGLSTIPWTTKHAAMEIAIATTRVTLISSCSTTPNKAVEMLQAPGTRANA